MVFLSHYSSSKLTEISVKNWKTNNPNWNSHESLFQTPSRLISYHIISIRPFKRYRLAFIEIILPQNAKCTLIFLLLTPNSFHHWIAHHRIFHYSAAISFRQTHWRRNQKHPAAEWPTSQAISHFGLLRPRFPFKKLHSHSNGDPLLTFQSFGQFQLFRISAQTGTSQLLQKHPFPFLYVTKQKCLVVFGANEIFIFVSFNIWRTSILTLVSLRAALYRTQSTSIWQRNCLRILTVLKKGFLYVVMAQPSTVGVERDVTYDCKGKNSVVDGNLKPNRMCKTMGTVALSVHSSTALLSSLYGTWNVWMSLAYQQHWLADWLSLRMGWILFSCSIWWM